MPKAFATKPLAALFASLLVFALGLGTARADTFGGDLPLLSALVANTAEQLGKLSQTISTLRQTYEETRRLAGYADEAYQAYEGLRHFNAQVLGAKASEALDETFPDLAYFRSEASRTGPWAESTGELQALLRYCLQGGATGANCASVQEALTMKQARSALEATFGPTPPVAGGLETNAMDYEASLAMAQSSSAVGKNAVTREEAKALMGRCTEGKSPADCEAAAAAASILALQQGADVGDQLAEANRLQAVRVAQENARRKRELAEALERRELLLDGAKQMAPRPVKLKTEGLRFFDEGDN